MKALFFLLTIRLIRCLTFFDSQLLFNKMKIRILFNSDSTRGPISESDIRHQRAILMNKYYKVRKQTSIRLEFSDKKINSVEYSNRSKDASVATLRPTHNSYNDPESLENIENFIKEISKLGMKTHGYQLTLASSTNSTIIDRSSSSNTKYNSTSYTVKSNDTYLNELKESHSTVMLNKNTNIRIEKLEKKSWKQSCRNYYRNQ